MSTAFHFGSNGNARRQRGAAAVEFAIVAMLFVTVILGIMEFGRLLYLWNTVQEVTRRAAREAVVRSFADAGKIQRAAVFNAEEGSGAAYLPAGLEITSLNVKINYLNGALAVADPMPTDPSDNISACNDATRAASCVRFVEACVATSGNCTGSVQYAPMAGIFPFLAISIPVSSVIMPAESLGFSL
jgi:TadE-like protein